jgi:hypothetical protein
MDEESSVMWTRRLALGILILAVAGGLRFYRLGRWSFGYDELPTFSEEASLFGRQEFPGDSQYHKLPRILPLAYSIHHVGFELFGRDELGSRVINAFFGTLAVLAVFLLLDSLEGRSVALATALMVAFWHEHVFQSQLNRCYIFAAFFSYACMLLGAHLLEKRTACLAAMVCSAGMASILCHTLTVCVVAAVVGATCVSWIVGKQKIPRSVILALLSGGAAFAALLVFYLLPLLRGWNEEKTWGYSVSRSVLGSLYSLGWPVALLALWGAILAVREGGVRSWYWLLCAGAWAAAVLVLPRLVVFHPRYVFPLALGPLVLAGRGAGAIYDGLRGRGRLVAASWLILVATLNLPVLVSHYVDGSRPDFRAAAKHVEKCWQPGDRVAAFSEDKVAHYAPSCKPFHHLREADPLAKILKLVEEEGRLWIVANSGRGGLREDLSQWLSRNCSHEFELRRNRIDYYENRMDVFLYPRADGGK